MHPLQKLMILYGGFSDRQNYLGPDPTLPLTGKREFVAEPWVARNEVGKRPIAGEWPDPPRNNCPID